ncbi:carboxypeptidase-like regulatory domain-containing protein [Litoribacter ruber]|uniref:TonB-dependent receptor n=1 Tax=Litoribacter ruber TaxID=702568 RepID=UPI001BDAF3B0|nr:carboxypeptidase-like regulatory domain-containing protein [Litoribacter ruber]MBT0811986.1 carboxypeptidase-like regulatory domain-containing protein [Litoribacter ruber]
MKQKLLFLLFVLIFPKLLSAQKIDQDRISGTFFGYSFDRFVDKIERETSYVFYYDQEQLAQIKVSLVADEHTVEQLLRSVFQDTDFKFAIDSQKRIFITQGKAMRVRFPALAISNDTLRPVADTLSPRAEEVESKGDYAENRIWTVGQRTTGAGDVKLEGRVLLEGKNEAVQGMSVVEPVTGKVTMTDENGYYTLALPRGLQHIRLQRFGLPVVQRHVNILGPGTLNIYLEEDYLSLGEVVVTSEQPKNISQVNMGSVELDINTIKKLPAVLGEVDVIRAILSTPGVKTVGEASVGFNVRGGAADQNLIMYNDATIFNPAHMFGIFSAFNSDLVEGVELYKAGAPMEYGGRLSSVLEVKGKYGNQEKIQGSGGIGLLTSRFSIDGPVSPKTTFAAGIRATYSDWLLGFLEEGSGFNNGRASFYDANLSIQHEIDSKNSLRLNAYQSGDSFRFERDTTFSYSNQNFNVGWTHRFNEDFTGDFVIGQDLYSFGIESNLMPENAFDFGFNLGQIHAKGKFDYRLSDSHQFTFGIGAVHFDLEPGFIRPGTEESTIARSDVSRERALETALFFGDKWEVNNRLSVDLGVRYVMYQFLGPTTVNLYPEGVLKTAETQTGTEVFEGGQIAQNYHGPEFRVFGRYILNNSTSLKAGFNNSRQHLHMVTNTAAISPTDTWKLSDPHLRPQLGQQVTLGLFKNLKKNTLEVSTEVYYRTMENLLDYRSGASLILNDNIERDVIRSEGKAYGMEFMIKKDVGRLNGWLSYTYSRSLIRSAPDEIGQKINNGNWYANNFDQPHDALLFLTYELTKRVSPSINANYSTGRPITLPIAKFSYQGAERIFFSDRNAHRIPDYFRVDFSVNIEGNHKSKKLAHSSWSLGIYNVLGRSNPYSAYFVPVNSVLQGYQLSIFAQPIPFVTYNFKF